MTVGPVRLDVTINYAVPRAGIPAAVSFRKWVGAALDALGALADVSARAVHVEDATAVLGRAHAVLLAEDRKSVV